LNGFVSLPEKNVRDYAAIFVIRTVMNKLMQQLSTRF